MFHIVPGETGIIPYSAEDGETGLYPQAKLYDTAGSVITTLNLTHIAGGLYQVTYTPTGQYEYITVKIIPYTDSSHTVKSEIYSSVTEPLMVKYFGSTGGQASGAIISVPTDEITGYLKKLLDKIKDLEKQLMVKSEFNPKKDMVMTDIKIPTVSFEKETKMIMGNINTLRNELPPDNRIFLQNISKEIKEVNKDKITSSDMMAIVNLIRELPKDRSDEIITAVRDIPQPPVPEPVDMSPLMDKIREYNQEFEIIKNMIITLPEPKNNQDVVDILIKFDEIQQKRFELLTNELKRLLPDMKNELNNIAFSQLSNSLRDMYLAKSQPNESYF